MSEQKARIVNLLSVPLTKAKQSILQSECQVYASATNYVMKLMIQKQINSSSKALQTLRDMFQKKFFSLVTSLDRSETVSPENAQSLFESRFNSDTTKRYREALTPKQDAQNVGPLDWYVSQYFKDVVRTASAEIARHRRLATRVRSLRDKTPYFKFGRIILSGPIVSVTETGCTILVTKGDEVPVPFDKRSRSREAVLLHSIAAGPRRFDRISFNWHKEGYLDIDIRLEVSATE